MNRGNNRRPGASHGQNNRPNRPPHNDGNHNQPRPPHDNGNHNQPRPPHNDGNHNQPRPPHNDGNHNQPRPPHNDGNHNQPRPPHNDGNHNQPLPPHNDGSHHQPRPPHNDGNHNRPLPPHNDGSHNQPRPPHNDGNHNRPHRPPIIPPIVLPRPEEGQSKRFMRAIMNDYAGQDISELGAVLLYLYENMTLEPGHQELAKELMEISENEMRHFHMLGDMIVSLGGDPEYRGEHQGSYFNASNMVYPKTLKEMLQINIQAETAAIQNYYQRVRIAPTQRIAQTLQNIIEDEQRHLSFFREEYRRLFGR